MNFPFVRDKFYRIGLLRSFLKYVSTEQRQNSALASAIRARKLPWAKLWEEELFPLFLYCDYNRLPDEDEFRITPDGDPIDATLRARSGEITRFQITTAYREENAESSQGGYIASIERQAINQGIPVFLGGVGKDEARRIISKPVVRNPASDSAEWQRGLINSIRKKVEKQGGNADCLLVFADRLVFDLLHQRQAVVMSTIRAALEGETVLSFQKLIVLDRDPQGYFECRPHVGAANSDIELCGP